MCGVSNESIRRAGRARLAMTVTGRRPDCQTGPGGLNIEACPYSSE